jgi:hypothetical protein
MHHLTHRRSLRELIRAAQRGVQVRVVINREDGEDVAARQWQRLLTAGGAVRLKRNNEDLHQLMHHKLAIVDGRILLAGSGNWSGSAFFRNWENWIRTEDPAWVDPLRQRFAALWERSIPAGAPPDASPGRARADETRTLFGNLHAHLPWTGPGGRQDDGRPLRRDSTGTLVEVNPGEGGWIRYAYRSAEHAGLDFLALTPHIVDDREDDAPDQADLSREGFDLLRARAGEINAEAEDFAALAGVEWSTNSTGNHVTVLGTTAPPKVERGRFDRLFGTFVDERREAGDAPVIVLNHPRTFRSSSASLDGNYDQLFDRPLGDVPSDARRGQKFNDYGLDDFPPLRDVRAAWIAGTEPVDERVVHETLARIEAATRDVVVAMEILPARGSELAGTTPVNPTMVPPWDDPDGPTARRTKVADWEYYLLRGFHLAPIASHDNHYANWGLGHTTRTAIQTQGEPTPTTILDALRRRAAYATEDPDLEVHAHVEGWVPTGSRLVTTKPTVTVSVRAREADDPDAHYRVLVRRGTVGDSAVVMILESDLEADRWLDLEIPIPAVGVHFITLRVHDIDDDTMAWTAPIRIERPAP